MKGFKKAMHDEEKGEKGEDDQASDPQARVSHDDEGVNTYDVKAEKKAEDSEERK